MKITMYELLGMVKDGKAPKKIKYKYKKYNFDDDGIYTKKIIADLLFECDYNLNDEVEIIEEEPTQEEIKEYTNNFLEAWKPVKKQCCKLFDELVRIGNVLDLEDELEEEKKIPENNFNYIYSCEDEHIMANFENIKTTLKDIIDYLKSKGDE
jgi:hypothetical protein